MSHDVQIVDHWPDDSWRERWYSRFAIPTPSDAGLVDELRTSIEPYLALTEHIPTEWIDFVPTPGSEWRVYVSTEALSFRRWNSLRALARQLGESYVLITPLESELPPSDRDSMTEMSWLVPTAFTYRELMESEDFEQVNVLGTDEVPYLIVGESGAWAFWTLAGSRADASVFSFDPQRIDPKIRADYSPSEWAAFSSNVVPAFFTTQWLRPRFWLARKELRTYWLFPTLAGDLSENDEFINETLVRQILASCKPASGSFETDFPWSAEESWPAEVSAAAERLCGRNDNYSQSGLRDIATSSEQAWEDFLVVAPHAYDASLFDESMRRIVSLSDCSESIVIEVNRDQLKKLRRELRGEALIWPMVAVKG